MDKLKYAWLDRRYQVNKRRERFVRWIVWHMPREFAMWSYVRVASHATTGKFENTIVPDLSMTEALKRWDEPNE